MFFFIILFFSYRLFCTSLIWGFDIKNKVLFDFCVTFISIVHLRLYIVLIFCVCRLHYIEPFINLLFLCSKVFVWDFVFFVNSLICCRLRNSFCLPIFHLAFILFYLFFKTILCKFSFTIFNLTSFLWVVYLLSSETLCFR